MTNTESNKTPADIERLERKIDEAIRRLDQECEELSKTASETQTPLESVRCRGSLLWGGLLLVVGLIWLASSMGWFKISVPLGAGDRDFVRFDLTISEAWMKAPRLALVGATGIVGKTTLDVFEEWNTPLGSLRLFSSAGSSGQRIEFRGSPYVVEELTGVPNEIDVAIFATSSTLSAQWVPLFRDAGITVIDHSSYFRMHKDVPLVIPEINAYAVKDHRGIIANPNCSASVMLLPLYGLHRAFGLRQVITSTYQSVSGAGRAATDELNQQTADSKATPEVFPVRIAANVIPQIGSFNESGVSGEEEKVGDEIRKILSAPNVHVLATTVRVPVHIGHAASVAVKLLKPVTVIEAREAMRGIPGLVFDESKYYTPLEIAGKQEVFAGRLRVDADHPDWLQFWVVGDNLRKGAASNAVQILEVLLS